MAKDELTYYGTPPGPPGPVEGEIVDRAQEPVEADVLSELRTAPVELTRFEMGFIHGFLYDSLRDPSDMVAHATAQAIYLKMVAASLTLNPLGLEGAGG
jgi:hypothetical protein